MGEGAASNHLQDSGGLALQFADDGASHALHPSSSSIGTLLSLSSGMGHWKTDL